MKRRWGDMKTNLTEIGWDGVYVISLAQARDKEQIVVQRVMDLQVQ
jgi:hypothetical protein